MTRAKISDATITNTALFCKNEKAGHVTLFFISSIDSTTKALIFIIINFCTGREIRTPINGFGDRYSTIELCPCMKLILLGTAKLGNIPIRNKCDPKNISGSHLNLYLYLISLRFQSPDQLLQFYHPHG
jgi:hypothetical protein